MGLNHGFTTYWLRDQGNLLNVSVLGFPLCKQGQ